MEGTIGEIRIFCGNFPPMGWAFCDGRTLPINQYVPLFSLIGTNYGGDGRTNFALPNLPSPLPEADPFGRYVICLEGIFPRRD